MECDTTEPDRQAFEILELIDSLRVAPWCQLRASCSQEIEKLLDDLEGAYRFAMEPWAIYRTTPGEMAQDDFYRWHEYMFPPDVYQEARWRFNELVTTSRFSVEESPCLFDLEQVHSANDKITNRHIVSLAVLVCIRYALEELEPLEFLAAQTDAKAMVHQIEQARILQNHADLWLQHLATLNAAYRESVFERRTEKNRISKQNAENRKNAKKKGSQECTPKAVAEFFRANLKPDRPKRGQQKGIISDLTNIYGISETLVKERLKQAKDDGLMQ